MPKFKFKSARKKKFNFITDKDDFLSRDIINGSHIEIFSGKKIIIEDCYSILDYQECYIKLKIKKGLLNISGNDFLITEFENKKIIIKGNILSLEFCVG